MSILENIIFPAWNGIEKTLKKHILYLLVTQSSQDISGSLIDISIVWINCFCRLSMPILQVILIRDISQLWTHHPTRIDRRLKMHTGI